MTTAPFWSPSARIAAPLQVVVERQVEVLRVVRIAAELAQRIGQGSTARPASSAL
jgi:hypothetical protein